MHESAVDDWRMLTANVLVGVAARALEIGVSYVKERQAFGAAIGSFQGVAHRLADCATAVDGARLLAYKAAWARDEDEPRPPCVPRWPLRFPARQHGRRLTGVCTSTVATALRSNTTFSCIIGEPGRGRAYYRLRVGRTGESLTAACREQLKMDFHLGDKSEAFRAAAKEFLAQAVTPELVERVHAAGDGYDPEFLPPRCVTEVGLHQAGLRSSVGRGVIHSNSWRSTRNSNGLAHQFLRVA